jgi:hypothetical protein
MLTELVELVPGNAPRVIIVLLVQIAGIPLVVPATWPRSFNAEPENPLSAVTV